MVDFETLSTVLVCCKTKSTYFSPDQPAHYKNVTSTCVTSNLQTKNTHYKIFSPSTYVSTANSTIKMLAFIEFHYNCCHLRTWKKLCSAPNFVSCKLVLFQHALIWKRKWTNKFLIALIAANRRMRCFKTWFVHVFSEITLNCIVGLNHSFWFQIAKCN